MEEIIINLIVNSGNGRSLAIEAIRASRNQDFDLANKLMNECEESLLEAHKVQTELIQKEAAGENLSINLLMVHAQDHLMNALTVKDLAFEIIELSKKINELETKNET